jgi:hypothetical protein
MHCTTDQHHSSIEVHILNPSQRRLLLELLASERAGEDVLHVGYFGRDQVAESLCDLGLFEWVSDVHVGLTEHGRWISESLAARIVESRTSLAS